MCDGPPSGGRVTEGSDPFEVHETVGDRSEVVKPDSGGNITGIEEGRSSD